MNRIGAKAARIALGLTQEELAEVADIGARSLQRFEAGFENMAMRTAHAIEKSLKDKGVVFLPGDRDLGPGFRLPANFSVPPRRPRHTKTCAS
jgi:transcriptional regulator with XRE-family HTH domain